MAAYDYLRCVPYSINEPTQELENVYNAVLELQKENKFDAHSFGSQLAVEACAVIKRLNALLRLKTEIPLKRRIELTQIFANACFNATEPSLMQRFAVICLNLWRSHTAQQELELKEAQNMLEWAKMRAFVRNLVILNENNHHHVVFAFSNKNRDNSFEDVVFAFARLFRNTFTLDKAEFDACFDEILSFIDPSGHTGVSTLAVLESLDVLTPHLDEQSTKIVPVLFGLWNLVPREVSSRYILSNLSKFVESSLRRNDECPLTFEQFKICFQGVLHALLIPLSSATGKRTNRTHSSQSLAKMMGLNAPAFAKLVVYALRPADLAVLDLLRSLMTTVESFIHPSNSGIWTALIMSMALSVVEEYVYRVNMESELGVSPELQLTNEISLQFTKIMFKPCLLGLFNPIPAVFNASSRACQHLAAISPQYVGLTLLKEFYSVLEEGSVHPQRLVAAISAFSLVCPHFCKFPELKMHLTTLAALILTNIDINEPGKCSLSLGFFKRLATVTKFEDLSTPETLALASNVLPQCIEGLAVKQYTEIDSNLAQNVCLGSSAAYPELCTSFMTRVFTLLELQPDMSENDIPASVGRVLLACSPEIFQKLLQICLNEITNPQQLCHNVFSRVCGMFVRADCSASFNILFSLLVSSIKLEIVDNQAGKGRTLASRDASLVRYISCLNMCLLAANSASIVQNKEELISVLTLLRENTGLGIVYTFANTVHHAISALVTYSVVLPDPLNNVPSMAELACSKSVSNQFSWNVPTSESRLLAMAIYKDQLEHAVKVSETQNVDLINQTLTLLRTTTGAIASLDSSDPDMQSCRKKVADLIVSLYTRANKDEESYLKALLFLCKVLMGNDGYERTAKLDLHQSAQYEHEKRVYKVPGTHKRTLPPVLLAKRAQVFHHQRLSVLTEHRSVDNTSKELIFEVLVKSCFSAYSSVRVNAFSALKTVLKTFDSEQLYLEVYKQTLLLIEQHLNAKEYTYAEGGFGLLKYGGIGKRTVAWFHELLPKFVEVSVRAATENTGNRELSAKATSLYYSIVPLAFRLPVLTPVTEMPAWTSILKVVLEFTSTPLTSLHWNEGTLKTATLFTVCEFPNLPISSTMFSTLANGMISASVHPDLKAGCLYGCLQIMHNAFRKMFVGYDFSDYKASGDVEVPNGAVKSADDELMLNDWSNLFSKLNSFPVAFKVAKDRFRPTAHIMKPNSQGWIVKPAKTWRSPTNIPQLQLSREDYSELKTCMDECNTVEVWKNLLSSWFVEPRKEEDKMLKIHAFLVRDLVIMSSLGFGNTISSLLETVEFTDLNDRNAHRVISEVVAGLLLSTPVCTDTKVVEKACTLLDSALNSLGPDNIQYWHAMIMLTCRSVDYRRFKPMIELVFKAAAPDSDSGIKLALKLQLRTEIQTAIGWRLPTLPDITVQWPKWDFDLQSIRSAAAEEASTALMASVHPLRQANTFSYAYLNKPLRLTEQTEQCVASLFTVTKPKSEFCLLVFILNSLQHVGGDPCLQFLLNFGIKLLLSCSVQRDDPELVVLVTKVFTELGSVQFTTAMLPEAMKLLDPVLTATHWHQRIRMLLFLQSFFFNHLFLMDETMRLQLGTVVKTCLYDTQIEVRELAGDTLNGIIRCSPPNEQQHYVNTFSKEFLNCLTAKPSRNAIDRHASVTGLGSLLNAFPYTSPPDPWVPKVLVTIAVKAAGDSSVVGKAGQQVLSDFKKTRQDTWHVDQKAFTQEQLEDLEGVLWKNYYA